MRDLIIGGLLALLFSASLLWLLFPPHTWLQFLVSWLVLVGFGVVLLTTSRRNS
jgi:uncharacterized membrane protein YccC